MKLIKISESTMINPEKITAIRIDKQDDGTTLILIVDGLPYTAELGAYDVLKELMLAGVELDKQFFAG